MNAPDTKRAARQARRAAKNRRGQTMVLGVVTLLVLAFMMMLSFNVANAIQNKIRLQAHSDAMTYSIAVVEARAMNFYAYSNRAIAAYLVAQATVHGWMSIASNVGGIMWAGAIAFFIIAAIEIGLCCSCPWCACVWHCWDALMATIVAFKFIGKVNTWTNKVKNRENQFNQVVLALATATTAVHSAQTAMTLFVVTKGALENPGTYSGIKNANIKTCATDLPVQIGGLNARSFACALEGSASDLLCNGPSGLGSDSHGKINMQARSKVMTNVANAARPGFDVSRGPTAPQLLSPMFMKEVYDTPGEGVTAPAAMFGESGITDAKGRSACMTSNKVNLEGKYACGQDFGVLGAQYRHGVGGMIYYSHIDSGDDGGEHSTLLGNPHTGNHPRFRGVQARDADPTCLSGNFGCFINFRANTGSRTMARFGNIPYYQQPVTYGAYQGSMRALRDNCNPGRGNTPWQITNSGNVTVGDGQRGQGQLTLLPPAQNATAISKAMVYYHRFDNWKAAPNLFDPYWRAKLHGFDRGGINLEAAAIAGLVGDTNGAGNAAAGPTEGVYP